jgi:hypothetical protein
VSERLLAMTDDELGAALAATGTELAWPPTPDVAGAVARTVRTQERAVTFLRPRLSLPSRRRTVVLIAAALLTLAAAALAAKFIVDLGAISVQVIPGRPTDLPTGPPGPDAFGRPVSIAEAAEIAGFEPLLPAALGSPDRVWVDVAEISFEGDTGSRIVLAWRPGPGLPRLQGTPWGAVLMQFEGEIDVASKLIFEDTGTVEPVFVDGRDAYFTSGEHELDLLTDDGVRRFRVTGNVVLWNDEGLALRLETALSKVEAIGLAGSVAS